MSRCYVYIMASRSRVLYVGVTDHLPRRVYQHKTGYFDGFSNEYKTDQLVYFERLAGPTAAGDRERQLKRWSRGKKVALIEAMNLGREDLARDGYGRARGGPRPVAAKDRTRGGRASTPTPGPSAPAAPSLGT